MNTTNPYSPPQSNVADRQDTTVDAELASRWLRLGGALLDGLFVAMITVPTMYVAGYWSSLMGGTQPELTTQLAWAAFGFLVFFVVHGYFLYRDGQTLAKRILGMRIVDLQGEKAPFGRVVGLRYLVPQLIYFVPIAGGLVGLIGLLLIFRADRRALHDLLAGTRVVKIR